MELTSKQKRVLKAIGQNLEEHARVGQAGVTDAFLTHVRDIFHRQELVKVRFGNADLQGQDRIDLAHQIASALQAHCISVVGRTVLLYREKEESQQSDAKRPPADPEINRIEQPPAGRAKN